MITQRASAGLLLALFSIAACSTASSGETGSSESNQTEHETWKQLPINLWATEFGGASTDSDGRVYAFGGGYSLSGDNSSSSSTYVRDPQSGWWRARASMTYARRGFGAVRGTDGRIYVVGGDDGTILDDPDSNPLRRPEVYDVNANSWSRIADTQKKRDYNAVAAGKDGRIYAIGGAASDASIEAYQPASDTWTTVAPMSTPRIFLAAATGLDGRIYAIGGSDNDLHSLSSVEVYDPSTNVWSAVAPMPSPRRCHAATTGKDGRIYVIGGETPHDFAGLGSNEVVAYDPDTNSWSRVASLPTPSIGLAATTDLEGRIIAFGGYEWTRDDPFKRYVEGVIYTP